MLCSKARCTVTLESVDTDSSCSKQTNHANDGKDDCCCGVANQGLTYVEHKSKSRGYSGYMCLYKKRAKPSSNKNRATARSEAKPPKSEDKRNERQSHTRGANARATRRSLGKDRETRSKSQTKADEERGGENNEHEQASKEHSIQSRC